MKRVALYSQSAPAAAPPPRLADRPAEAAQAAPAATAPAAAWLRLAARYDRPLLLLAGALLMGLAVLALQRSGPASRVLKQADIDKAVLHTLGSKVLPSPAAKAAQAVAPAVVPAVAPVPVLVDAAQTAGGLDIDFRALGAAALACSGHKGLLGPPGIGLLLLAPGFEIEPLLRGGTGSRSESEEMPEQLPDRLEAGTPNGVGAAGLGAACRWLLAQGVGALRERQQRLARRLADALRELPGAASGLTPERQRFADRARHDQLPRPVVRLAAPLHP